MKRHQSLYPLSHDHHHALVQARSLSAAGASNDRDIVERTAADFARFWKDDLQPHFYQEEQVVLPMLAKRTSLDSAEIRETLNHHAEITRLAGELNDKLTRREMIEPGMLNALGESLRSHIRFEENEMFPAVESALSEEELWQMNTQLTKLRSQTGHGSVR